jgi:ACS family hexuronate transporter-like MFS transporter
MQPTLRHSEAAAPGVAPTRSVSRRRWLILGLIFSAIVLNYVDRQILSILKPDLKSHFGFDDRGYALLVNVFTVGYAAMYPVAGWMVDRFGARSVMLLGILGWSAACIGAGFARTLGQFTFFRGSAGVDGTDGVSLAVACGDDVVSRRLARHGEQRGRGRRDVWRGDCAAAGGLAGPFIRVALGLRGAGRMRTGDRGIMGGDLSRSSAGNHGRGDGERRRRPARIHVVAALGTRTLWGILLIRFISDPVWYFCLFWLPGYLRENSGLTLAQIGAVGWIPFLAADLGGIASAAWSDRMVKHGTAPLVARKRMLTAMAALAPLCVLTPHLPHPAATLAIFSLVAAACLSWLFSLSVVIAETFPTRNVASVLGIAGGFGASGAVLFNAYVGEVMVKFGPGRVFAAMALLHPIAAVILWTMTRKEGVRPQARAN